MYYEAELRFLKHTLQKLHLQIAQLRPELGLEHRADYQLRKLLGNTESYLNVYRDARRHAKERTLYRLTDAFLCRYIFFLLPETSGHSALLIGPYMSFRIAEGQIMEEAERLGLTRVQRQHLQEFYLALPVLADDSALMAMVHTFAETIWGSEGGYEVADINFEADYHPEPLPAGDDNAADTLQFRMQALETRYAYENELMEIISKGLVHQAEQMLNTESLIHMEQRSADPLRSIKYYCIISNTLFRKAAERGGVHPMYLDRISSDYAQRIDALTAQADGRALIGHMARSYCRLVRRHATQHYAAPVQRAILHIDSNLSEPLSLKLLAELQGIHPSYLSTLFKKETGLWPSECQKQAKR